MEGEVTAAIVTAFLAGLAGLVIALNNARVSSRKSDFEIMQFTMTHMQTQMDCQDQAIIVLQKENVQYAVELEGLRQQNLQLREENEELRKQIAKLTEKIEQYKAGKPPTGPLKGKDG